jgi:hypothetical protein
MPRPSILISLLMPFLLLPAVDPTYPGTVQLEPGDQLPQISAQTLTGRSLDLPSTAAGHLAVIVFSVSRSGGKDARVWDDRLLEDFPHLSIYSVILLESVPGLFRGMALSGIRGGMPPGLQDHTVVLFRDESLWKQYLTAADESHAYVMLLGPEGRILWLSHRAFTDDQYRQLYRRCS